jgi:hypothetical protein
MTCPVKLLNLGVVCYAAIANQGGGKKEWDLDVGFYHDKSIKCVALACGLSSSSCWRRLKET